MRFPRLNPGLQARLPGLAAAAALALTAFAILRRRFRAGVILFHVAVALGERWSEGRARKRIGALLSARTGPAPGAAAFPARLSGHASGRASRHA